MIHVAIFRKRFATCIPMNQNSHYFGTLEWLHFFFRRPGSFGGKKWLPLWRIDLDDMWGFFDLDAPSSRRSMDPTDPLLQKLKGKLNRQRLLFHPDKNGHPEAGGDFVGLSKKKELGLFCFCD